MVLNHIPPRLEKQMVLENVTLLELFFHCEQNALFLAWALWEELKETWVIVMQNTTIKQHTCKGIHDQCAHVRTLTSTVKSISEHSYTDTA